MNVVHQLALLKVSPTQIAKRTRMARADVDHAVAVGKSTTARDLTRHTNESTGELTLEHLAAIAEFEDDSDAVQKLIRAAHSYGITHTLAGLRSTREEAKERAVEAVALEARGLRVVVLDRSTEAGQLVHRLDFLTDANGERLTVDIHASCPGHVAWPIKEWVWVDIDGNELPDDDDDEAWTEGDDADDGDGDDPYAGARNVQRWHAEYGCDNPAAHGHVYIFSEHQGNGKIPSGSAAAGEKTEEQKEAERVERRRVIAGNKQWDTAEGVRRAWLRQFLARKTPPVGSLEFIAQGVAHADVALRVAFERNHPLAAELFGLDVPDHEPAYLYGRSRQAVLDMLDGATEKRQTVLTLGLLLAAYEAGLHRMSWRDGGSGQGTHRYLRFLADHGYELCNTERLAADLPTEDNGDEIHTD